MGSIKESRKDNDHFIYTNTNPINSKTSDDCVVRTISIATNKTWKEVYKSLCNIGLELSAMPSDDKVIEKYLERIGWKKNRQLRKPDNSKYKVREMAKISFTNNTTYIIRVASHLTVVRNGFILDTWDCEDKTCGNFWSN